MELSEVQTVSNQICGWINEVIHPNSTNTQRYEANEQLNRIIQNVSHSKENVDNNLKLAFELISKSKLEIVGDNGYLFELYVYFGFKLLENLIKYQWYQLEANVKVSLLQSVQHWCTSRFFTTEMVPNRISISKLILSACSHCIAELFIRTWPSHWQSFLDDVTSDYSLVTIYSFLDISYYLNTILIPANYNRRKEIISSFMLAKKIVYGYISKCLQITEFSNFSMNEYIGMVRYRSIELMESLLSWYIIADDIIIQLLQMALSLNSDDRIRLGVFRCVQVIIHRSNLRPEDSEFVEKTFFNFMPSCFAHCLIKDILPNTVNIIVNNGLESEEMNELHTLVFEICVDIVCKALNLYNQIATAKTVLISYEENQIVWSAFIESIIKLLEYNSIDHDESILKFVMQYSRFDRSPNDEKQLENTFRSPIKLTKELDLRLLTLISRNKIEPIDEATFNQSSHLIQFVNFDSYEHYEVVAKQNRSKYLGFINRFVNNNLEVCQEFIINQLKQFLQLRAECSSGVLATLCSAIIPKLNLDPQLCFTFENLFEQLFLQLNQDTLLEVVRSNILSYLSSMSQMFSYFKSENIINLLNKLFDLTLAANRFQVTELRNHAGALFIRLSLNCSANLLPYFEKMRTYIDSLISNQLISNSQFCILYEGLIILSNHLDIQTQMTFIFDQLLYKLNWLINYQFGVEGINFFTEIGLTREPNLNTNQLPYFQSERFICFNAAIDLLTRLMRRINLRRLHMMTWPRLLDYIKPISMFITCFHRLWSYQRHGNALARSLCHSFYANYIFDELPSFYLLQISIEQSSLLLKDKLKTLFAEWDRESPPSIDLIGYHTQSRLWKLYSFSVQLLNLFNIYLIEGHLANPTDTSSIDSMKILIESFNVDLCHLPAVAMSDGIRFYFNDLAAYSPRTDLFVTASNIISVLDSFIRHIYKILDRHFQTINENKKRLIMESHPAPLSLFNLSEPSLAKCSIEQNLELCGDAVMSLIAQQFIMLLQNIFNNVKSVDKKAVQEQSNIEVNEEEMESDIPLDNDNNKANLMAQCQVFNDEGLSKYFLNHPTATSSLVSIVANTLLWPVNNLKRTILIVNELLVNSLIANNRIQSVEGFYFFAEKLLRTISMIDKSEPEQMNRLTNIFINLYENIVLKHGLAEEVNQQLSNFCSTDVQSWHRLADTCSDSKLIGKKKQTKVKTFLENISSKDQNFSLSSLHSMSKPIVHCLACDDKESANTTSTGNSGHDSDILLSLQWLSL